MLCESISLRCASVSFPRRTFLNVGKFSRQTFILIYSRACVFSSATKQCSNTESSSFSLMTRFRESVRGKNFKMNDVTIIYDWQIRIVRSVICIKLVAAYYVCTYAEIAFVMKREFTLPAHNRVTLVGFQLMTFIATL